MALVDRIKNILLTPKTEWPVIAGENTGVGDLMKNYVAILALIPAVAGFIGTSIVGVSGFISYRIPIAQGIALAFVGYVLAFVSVFISMHVVNALAPTFGAEKNLNQAAKVTVYSFTAGWVGGIFSIMPALSILGILATLYGCYLLYLGLPVLMKNPEEKSIAYTVVVIIAIIVITVVMGAITAAVAGLTGAGRGMFTAATSSAPEISIGGNKVDTAKLEAFGKKMEEAAAKMEAAQKSGNQEEAMKAAMSGLGTALSGGKSVDPLAIDQLKPFVPETFAGLAKKSSSAEKSGAMGITVSRAEARYGDDGGKSAELEISDTGGASGWLSFAGWAMVQGEKQDEYGSEKTTQSGNRIVHEKSRKDGRNEYNIVLGQRFIVTAKGNGVDLNTLKTAVASLDLAKLEAMKDVGVQK